MVMQTNANQRLKNANFALFSDPNIDEKTSKDILARAVECCPDLSLLHKGVDDLKIVGNVVGIRPTRQGGPRVQNEYFSKLLL